MTNKQRLDDALAVLRRLSEPTDGPTTMDDGEAAILYDDIVANDLPRLNAHLKAGGLRPIRERTPRDSANPPAPSLRLTLLGIDIATRFQSMERRIKQRLGDE